MTTPTKGIESIKAALSENCQTPGSLVCSCRDCSTYRWIIDRAEHYAEFLNNTPEEVMTQWELGRDYNIHNFYQDANQPKLDSPNVILLDDWIEKGQRLFGDPPQNWRFVCPKCKHVQTPQDFIDLDVEPNRAYQECIGRYDHERGCDWAAFGLFKITNTKVIDSFLRASDIFSFDEGA